MRPWPSAQYPLPKWGVSNSGQKLHTHRHTHRHTDTDTDTDTQTGIKVMSRAISFEKNTSES